jgi:hypothetical protein
MALRVVVRLMIIESRCVLASNAVHSALAVAIVRCPCSASVVIQPR